MMSPGLISGFWPGWVNSFSATRPSDFRPDIDDGEFFREADDAAGDDGAVKAGVAAERLIEKGCEILFVTRALEGLGGGA